MDAALYQIQAQFLVALALFNYMETLGMFMAGYYKNKKGETVPTSCRERFEKFFKSLGTDYEKLLKQYDVYDELRCGLTHELIPKKYNFTISHVSTHNDWNKKKRFRKRKNKKAINNKHFMRRGVRRQKQKVDYPRT